MPAVQQYKEEAGLPRPVRIDDPGPIAPVTLRSRCRPEAQVEAGRLHAVALGLCPARDRGQDPVTGLTRSSSSNSSSGGDRAVWVTTTVAGQDVVGPFLVRVRAHARARYPAPDPTRGRGRSCGGIVMMQKARRATRAKKRVR